MSADWVGYRLAVLCANKAGVARGRLTAPDHAVRAALLIDLALRNRISFGTEQNHVDTTPTGFPPADALLSRVADGPAGSMAEILAAGPPSLLDVLDPTRMTAGWFRRRSSVRLEPALVARERSLVREAADSGRADSPETAALTVLAGALNLTETHARKALIAECGTAGMLVADCAVYLDQLMRKMELIRAAGSGGG